MLKVLGPDDAEALESFLRSHADSSMFLRSNVRAAGLVYRGEPYQSDHLAKLVDGRVVGVAAHAWNGMVVLQAPVGLAKILPELMRHSRRPVAGLSGPLDQVRAARDLLGLSKAPTNFDSREGLFALDFSELIVPEALRSGRVQCRRSRSEDRELLTRWTVSYQIEALGETENDSLWESCRRLVERAHRERRAWVLCQGERRVSTSSFNACLPDCVQIGGVWTPPELRNRGYARCVVAGSLLTAAEEGVQRAILFTDNAAARRAYVSLAFGLIGQYGLVQFAEPQQIAG